MTIERLDTYPLSTDLATQAELEELSTALSTAVTGKAPTNHRSTASTYGLGNATYYGHVKLSDALTSVNSATTGIAATPYAVKQVNDKFVNYVLTATNNALSTKVNALADLSSKFNDYLPLSGGTLSSNIDGVILQTEETDAFRGGLNRTDSTLKVYNKTGEVHVGKTLTIGGIATEYKDQFTALSVTGNVQVNGNSSLGSFTNTVNGGSAAVGNQNTATGQQAFAAGYGNTASGNHAVALGFKTTSKNAHTTTLGMDAVHQGWSGNAIGYAVKGFGGTSMVRGKAAISEHDDAYVWSSGRDPETAATKNDVWENNSKEAAFPTDSASDLVARGYYNSHGLGTFNINPVGGLSGIYVGEENLADLISSEAKNTIANTLSGTIAELTDEDSTTILMIHQKINEIIRKLNALSL